jgi:mannose-6-phosphate isomerase-like protein (cupin superfamily)
MLPKSEKSRKSVVRISKQSKQRQNNDKTAAKQRQNNGKTTAKQQNDGKRVKNVPVMSQLIAVA